LEILDRHYKIQLTVDHRAKFYADQPTHPGDLTLTKKNNKTAAVKHKSFQKLPFSGGLKNKTSAVKHMFAPKTIISSWTNKGSILMNFHV